MYIYNLIKKYNIYLIEKKSEIPIYIFCRIIMEIVYTSRNVLLFNY